MNILGWKIDYDIKLHKIDTEWTKSTQTGQDCHKMDRQDGQNLG